MASNFGCCNLHKFMDDDLIGEKISLYGFGLFVLHIYSQMDPLFESTNLHNPNEMEGYIYISKGLTTKYLNTVCQIYVTFNFLSNTCTPDQPQWMPVLSLKPVQTTKSLIFIAKVPFSLSVMHLISYYEMYLSNKTYSLVMYMSYYQAITTLLFIMYTTSDASLIANCSKTLAKYVMCTNNTNFNLILTLIVEHSLTSFQLKSIYSYFPQFIIHPLCNTTT